MIETILEFCADLDEGCQKTPLRALFTTDNNLAHTFRVQLTRNKRRQLITLTDEKVTGYFIRYRDNATVMIQGSVVEGKASVTLTSACYAMRGMFSLAIVVGEGETANTVFLGEGSVSIARTDSMVDEENVVPSLSDLLAQIDRMKEATTDAGTATQRADTAAQNADDKARQAQTAAGMANNAAQRADTAAEAANDSAAMANQAVENAEDAAAYIEGTTVSAHKLAPGSTPTAQASTVDGHLHIEYGLVTGNKGAKGDQGPAYTIKGPAYATVAALASAVTSPAEGDQYNVGSAPPYHIYRWTGSAWEDQGALQGPAGADGAPGPQGPAGPKGADGANGANGADGAPGPGVAAGGTTGQVLVKASGADYDTVWGAPPASGTTIELLWENASPGSAFPPQKITADLSGYDMYLLIVNFHTTVPNSNSYIAKAGNDTLACMNDSGNLFRRVVTYADDGLTISKSTGTVVQTGAAKDDNAYIVPAQLYGIKGVQ